MLEVEEVDRVRSMCERTLRQNWIEGVRAADGTAFAYTRPSPGHYPWQWFWDSCFAAIVWRRFDETRAPDRARDAARRPARGRVHRPHDLLGRPADRGYAASPTT